MYLISIVLCTVVLFLLHLKVNVSCKAYAEKNVKTSRILYNAALYDDVSISAVINNDTDNNNTPLIDNVYFGYNENIGESVETSEESSLQNDFFSGGYSLYPIETPEIIDECVLERSEFYLSWWVYENGSLRMPTLNRTAMSGFLDLSLQLATETMLYDFVLSFTSQNPGEVIRIMSIASNKLKNIPSSVLNLTSSSIQYLSLADNNFYNLFEEENTTFENFTSFPLMTNLMELDLRNCHMMSLKYSYFSNLPKLFRLFLSHNYFTTISTDLKSLVNLQHLDLSYNKLPPNHEGLILDEQMLENLPILMFLDFSHSKLSNKSIKSLRRIGPHMKQLSLCYTGITTLEKDMFSRSALKVLDLSGNKGLHENLTPHHFQNLDDHLEIFVYRDGGLNKMELFTYLRKLRMLDLRNNQISTLAPYDFALLRNLEILDLAHNKIKNWKYRVFSENKNIKVVNLRNNNITMIKQEMLQDFYETQYLAIGSNNFICACNLRDFIDRASRNALYHHCNDRRKRSLEAFLNMLSPENQYNVFLREFHTIVLHYEESYRNILAPIFEKMNLNAKTSGISYNQNIDHNDSSGAVGLRPFNENDCYNFDSNQTTRMNFNFLLLDYNENDYKCFEYDVEAYNGQRKRKYFNEIESCYEEIDSTGPSYEGSSDETTYESDEPDAESITRKPPHSRTFGYLYLNLLIIIPMAIFVLLWYWKRSDIKYFFTILKNTLILSLDTDDKKALVLSNCKKSNMTNSIDHFTYDVFVSYSDNDRSWVLDELIPNIERRADINICLHERDFQVGLSILENIIQCMDKSRCLLLVVSESFLKSNWCAFEMHLAQHRLIETRREQLILVLLHDIPRARRTRTLQFLMRTKTYIMWPQDGKAESRLTFWKRLKKAIVLNDRSDDNKMTPNKQRHSIV